MLGRHISAEIDQGDDQDEYANFYQTDVFSLEVFGVVLEDQREDDGGALLKKPIDATPFEVWHDSGQSRPQQVVLSALVFFSNTLLVSLETCKCVCGISGS